MARGAKQVTTTTYNRVRTSSFKTFQPVDNAVRSGTYQRLKGKQALSKVLLSRPLELKDIGLEGLFDQVPFCPEDGWYASPTIGGPHFVVNPTRRGVAFAREHAM